MLISEKSIWIDIKDPQAAEWCGIHNGAILFQSNGVNNTARDAIAV